MDKKRELRFKPGLKLATHKEFEKYHQKIIFE